jgi:hemolysin type calcium-binding protein
VARWGFALTVLIALLGVVASAAEAATVSLVPNEQIGALPFTLTYQAAPGEANRLTVQAAPDGRVWSFRDAGATVQPGANCAAADAGATCTAPSIGALPFNGNVIVDLGDQSDVADVSSAHSGIDLDAGAGDDRLIVRSGFASASMGPGDDAARADAGQLSVEGGPGADDFEARRGAAVQVTYFESPTAVHVTTNGRADDGVPGEHDDVSPLVRTINGSAHGDVLDARAARTTVALYGEAGDDRAFTSPRGGFIEGGGGSDVLRGGNGDDDLIGDPGSDALFGGPGDDGLRGDSGHDLLVGGPGHDSFYVTSDGRDTVRARDGARDRIVCEWLPHSLRVDRGDQLARCAFPVVVSAQSPITPDRRLRLTLRCPWPAPGGCRGVLVLFDSRPRPLGRARFALPAGAVRRLAVPLARKPLDLALTAVVVARRARPPASRRTTVSTFQLSAR